MNVLVTAYEAGSASLSARLGGLLFAALITGSVVILGKWLRHSGPKALEESRPRRNCIPLYLPFVLFMAWLGFGIVTAAVISRLLGEPGPVPDTSVFFGAMAIVQVFMIIGMSILAVFLFPRGLRGMGLDARTLRGDVPGAIINLVAVMPLVYLGIVIVDLLGRLFRPDFEIRGHEALEALTGTGDPFMRLLILSFVLIVVPIFEELLFRGILQSTIRGYVRSAWVAIFITSALFAVMHLSHHWLAIFILSAGMGYAYERSGSLFRPIIMHAVFNTTSVVAALVSQ